MLEGSLKASSLKKSQKEKNSVMLFCYLNKIAQGTF